MESLYDDKIVKLDDCFLLKITIVEARIPLLHTF